MTTEPAAERRAAPRTLADELRSRPDDALAALLRARPDLLSPVPGDLSQLATRAGARTSVLRALERLDRFALQVAEALAVAPDPCPYGELAALLPGGEDELPRALGLLRERAIVWGGDERLRLVRTARELLAPSASRPSPTGLGPSLAEATAGMSPGRLQEILTAAGLPTTHDPVSALESLTSLFGDRERMDALLEQAPEEARAMLAKLVWGPPYGEVSEIPSPPVRWLLDRALLLPAAPRTVVLPREAALHLRGGRAHRRPEPLPPPVGPGRARTPAVADSAGAGQALAALAAVEELLELWSTETGAPPVLRSGGLGVRDLKRTAVALDVSEPVAAFWIELAYAAGLLASDGEEGERYAPTPAYDTWLEEPPERRWTHLARAWLAATRLAGLVGGRDARSRTLGALGPGLDRGPAPELRRHTLGLLAAEPAGTAPEADAVAARLDWECPLRGGAELRGRIVRWTLTEAELLGVTGRGALTSYARPLLDEHAADAGGTDADGTDADTAGPEPGTAGPEAAASLLAPLLPEPLDHVLLQADLTAVAPGPLRRHLAETLNTLADVESKGGATVYRFTPESVRRALDAGHGAGDLHAFLAAHSRTPVPQPLAYLIDDVARRHGRLRVGAAGSYVRCDDDTLLAEIAADRRAASLGLRLLAPTVLAAQADPATLLERLRAMGYAPAAESAGGDVVVHRADALRTPPRTAPEPVPDGPPAPGAPLLAAAVRAIRSGDVAAGGAPPRPRRPVPAAPGGPPPRTPAADTLAVLRAAARRGTAVRIGHVDADGTAGERVVEPVRVEGGFVTAYDHTAEEIRTYPLHRVTGAADAEQ